MENEIKGRTLREIGGRYDAKRNAILANIRDGRSSASMSGIEYCPKPWADLDMTNPGDVQTISSALTWTGDHHDCAGLRKLTPRELELQAERTRLSYLPHEQRKGRWAEIDAELKALSPTV